MKSLRTGAALLCAATLAACGGSSGNLTLGGTVTGLNKTGLQLQNGAEIIDVTSGSSSFFFKTLIGNEEQFNISIKTQPTNAKCTLANNTGKANYYTVLQAVVSCVTDPYVLGGTVSGLAAGGLVLANGSSTVAVPAGSTGFTFADKVPNGSLYGVTVLAQPAGLKCVVANGSGTMPAADLNTLAVSCQPAA